MGKNIDFECFTFSARLNGFTRTVALPQLRNRLWSVSLTEEITNNGYATPWLDEWRRLHTHIISRRFSAALFISPWIFDRVRNYHPGKKNVSGKYNLVAICFCNKPNTLLYLYRECAFSEAKNSQASAYPKHHLSLSGFFWCVPMSGWIWVHVWPARDQQIKSRREEWARGEAERAHNSIKFGKIANEIYYTSCRDSYFWFKQINAALDLTSAARAETPFLCSE